MELLAATTKFAILWAVTALVSSATVRAQESAAVQTHHWPAERLLPPEPGRKACWRIVYDAKHLAAHPQQKVTQLTFLLRVSGYDVGGNFVFKNPDHVNYSFALSLKRRGDKRALTTAGDCLGEKSIDCSVDCDGGGVTIDKLPSGDGLSVRLYAAGIAFGGDCDTTTGTWVKPRADDKVFRLNSAPIKVCRKLDKEYFGDWPDQPEQ